MKWEKVIFEFALGFFKPILHPFILISSLSHMAWGDEPMDEETLPKNQGWGVRWPLEAPMLYHISGAPLSPSRFWVLPQNIILVKNCFILFVPKQAINKLGYYIFP